MADDERMPGELERDADEELVRRLRAWYEAQPPAGSLDRAIAHVDRERERGPGTARHERAPLLISVADRSLLRRSWPAVAAAAALFLIGIKIAGRNPLVPAEASWQPSPIIGSVVTGANLRIVRFAVTLPSEAPKEVRLVGDFNGWGAAGLALARNPATGRWEGNVELPPGLHHYTYLVDGSRWMIDPGAPSAGDDLLGATNAIVVPDAR